MKKILSIILAAAMLMSLVPSVFAVEGETAETIVYTYNLDPRVDTYLKTTTLLKVVTKPDGNEVVEGNDAAGSNGDIDYTNYTADRNWQVFDASEAVKNTFKTTPEYSKAGFDANGLRVSFQEDEQWFALKIRVPEPGIYKLATKIYKYKSSRLPRGFMSLYPDIESASPIAYSKEGMGVLNPDVLLSDNIEWKDTSLTAQTAADVPFDKVLTVNAENDEFVYVFGSVTDNTGSPSIKNFTLTKVSDTVTFGDTKEVKLEAGKNQTVVADLVTYKGKRLAGASEILYSTENTEVATVEDGVVTAVGGGETTLTARIGDATATIPVKVTAPAVTPEYEEAFGEDTYTTTPGITFDALEVHALAYATDGSAIAPANIKATDNENGTYTVTTDAEADGYTFRYWAKGLQSKERKRIVSFANEFTYTPSNEKNYLIAVYDKEETTSAATEYYNANGQKLANGDELPYMAGYGQATGWKEPVYGIKEAIYGEPLKYNITIGNAEPVEYAWGTPVICPKQTAPEGQEFWGWKKTVNNVDVGIVSTDPEYTFYAWETCTVTPVFGVGTPVFDGEKRRIILGTFLLGGKTAVMAEFFGFDDAFERGITIDGTDYAMTNKNADQFTIVDDDNKGNISGYAILEGGLKLIYNLPVNNAE